MKYYDGQEIRIRCKQNYDVYGTKLIAGNIYIGTIQSSYNNNLSVYSHCSNGKEFSVYLNSCVNGEWFDIIKPDLNKNIRIL